MLFRSIGRFIDAPLKYYSQGMYVRLAFGMAVFVEPDILLIDDILSVGDRDSQERCVEKILSLKDQKKTIIVVSHNMNMIKKFCDRVILLEKGNKIYEGISEKAIFRYMQIYGDDNERAELFLDNDKIRIVFNNGRIFISYNDIPLTKGSSIFCVFFFNDTATTEIYTLSLHDALPICLRQLILGNATRDVLESAAIPVLMGH